MKKLTPKKKKIIISVIILIFIVALILFFIFFKTDVFSKKPTLIVETPPKQSISDKGEFTVDVSLSSLGDELYPAASLSVAFDSSRLEFTGIEEGNIMVFDDKKENGISAKLPDWSVDVDHCNEAGQINVMYLDMTGGKYAFSNELMEDSDNVLMRFSFRLRGSAKAGDIYELAINDAVFAASDESKSLAVTNKTLKTQNGRIVVGE